VLPAPPPYHLHLACENPAQIIHRDSVWGKLVQPRLTKAGQAETEFIQMLYCARVFVCLKAAQAVLITLYNLNPDEFMLMLSVLPKTFQVCLLLLIISSLLTFSDASEVRYIFLEIMVQM